MDSEIRDRFLRQWKKHFSGSEWPLVCWYADELDGVDLAPTPKPNNQGYTCIFSQLSAVVEGRSQAFNAENLTCIGGVLNLGFGDSDVPDEVADHMTDVDRYKKSRTHTDEFYQCKPPLKAPGRHLVFKRWDKLTESDEPQVVIFFGTPDVIAGLHALANFDVMTPHGVLTPFGSGCDALIIYPLREMYSDAPKAVLGGLDPSMRTHIKPNLLTFSAPWPKFLDMLNNMDESFLTAECWKGVKSRME